MKGGGDAPVRPAFKSSRFRERSGDFPAPPVGFTSGGGDVRVFLNTQTSSGDLQDADEDFTLMEGWLLPFFKLKAGEKGA